MRVQGHLPQLGTARPMDLAPQAARPTRRRPPQCMSAATAGFLFTFILLVSAFLVKSARLLQWLVFFSSDYNLTLIGPLFLQSKLLKLLP